MKKFIISIFVILFLVIGAIYSLAFTSFGNSIVASVIEDKLNETKKAKFKVLEFMLNFDNLKFSLEVDDNSRVDIEGGFSIFKQIYDLNYNINIKDLSKFEAVTNQKFNGSLNTKGLIRGDVKELIIKGDTNLASSESEYYANLKEFKPQKVVVSIKSLDIKELLYILNQPSFISGKIDLYTKLVDIDLDNPKKLNGELVQKLYSGEVNIEALQKEFNINLPPMNFEEVREVKFENGNLKQTSKLSSNLLTLNSTALVDLVKEKLNLNYDLNIKDLSKFENTLNYKLNGDFKIDGKVVGDKNLLNISGKSDIANSKTTYTLDLKKLKPKDIKVNILKADIEKLLYILNQPIYAFGNIDINADIKNPTPMNLNGKVVTKIYNGKVNNKVAKNELKLDIKDVNFKGDIDTFLDKSEISSKVSLLTSIVNLYSKNVVFDLKDKSLKADYLVKIPDLNKLYFVTKRDLKGNLAIDGEVLKSEKLIVTGKSQTLGGDFNFKLVENEFRANMEGMKVSELTEMLLYPKFFDSIAKANLYYDLNSSKGEMVANLSNGQFLPNEFSMLLKSVSDFDITKEVYNDINLTSKIDKNLIYSNLDMVSQNTKIASNDTIFNLDNSSINSTLLVKIKDRDMNVNLSGYAKSPKIKLDTKGYLKQKALEKIEKHSDKIEKAVDKFIPENLKKSEEFQNIKKGVEDVLLKQLDKLF